MHIAFITKDGYIDDFTTDKSLKKHFNKLPRRNHGYSPNSMIVSHEDLPATYFAGYYNQLLYFFNTARNTFVTRQASKVDKVKNFRNSTEQALSLTKAYCKSSLTSHFSKKNCDLREIQIASLL